MRVLEREVVLKLLQKGYTLSVAESCTGGLLSSRIVNVEGASKVFLGGFVVYSNKFKEKFLKVRGETLKKFGAVSEEVCREMLKGVMRVSGSDFGVAITGVAGPTSSERKPVGLTYVGIGFRKRLKVYRFNFEGTRNEIRFLATQESLKLLLKWLNSA